VTVAPRITCLHVFTLSPQTSTLWLAETRLS
jgi:hypothetical protein